MIMCRSTFTLLLTLSAASLIMAGGCGEKREAGSLSRPALDGAYLAQETSVRTRVARPYGKIRVPAELFVDLIRPEQTADPFDILVSVSSPVAASSSLLTLRIPQISGEPGRTEVLWTGSSSDPIDAVEEYRLPALSVGRYHFVAVIEFTPEREGADTLVLSKSLYVDVRPEEVLSSNVSFRQMERQALYRKLEDRALVNLSPRLATASVKTRARYRQQMEATHPGRIEEEIARLRAADPEVARQIMALNSSRETTESDLDAVKRSEQGRPVREKAVPVR
jgi:hypothetical protein